MSTLKNIAPINYSENPWLIPIKPELQMNEEYGFVRITLPKEIIKYNSNVESTHITVPNCYGCGAVTHVYDSLDLMNTVGFIDIAGDITRNITTTTAVTSAACVGFAIAGKYRLLKEINTGNFKELDIIDCDNSDTQYIYDDYEIEQGFEYRYYLIPYTDNTSIGSKPAKIRPQWDSILISDAQGRLLTIQYNPQVSSFKTVIQEQKQDTLGGKYPFFLRNGDSYYKEIPLSGLISYHADPLNKFGVPGMPEPDILTRQSSQKDKENYFALLDQDEYYLERVYKREVEAWLNNGEPKLLRTAAEGNFIVRLMNVSLSPIQQLGRRVHSFSATAYEIIEYTDSNVEQYGLNCLNSVHTTDAITKMTFIGSASKTFAHINITNLPTGLNPQNAYRLMVNSKLNIPITKIILNNEDNDGENYVNFVVNGQLYSVGGGTTKEIGLGIDNSVNCYLINGIQKVNELAYLQLEYESATLASGG